MVVSILLAVAVCHADTPPLVPADQMFKTKELDTKFHNLLLRHPAPVYPAEAMQDVITGKGVFSLRFDYKTGRLREIHVEKSTGSPILDAASISALKNWRAKPRHLHTISVPIEFAFGGNRHWKP